MHNDAPVAPAPFKIIASFLHATWAERLVQKRPRELLLPMQLQGASSANPDVLQAKVRVRLSPLISPAREDSPQVSLSLWHCPGSRCGHHRASHTHDHTSSGQTASRLALPEPGPGDAGRPADTLHSFAHWHVWSDHTWNHLDLHCLPSLCLPAYHLLELSAA